MPRAKTTDLMKDGKFIATAMMAREIDESFFTDIIDRMTAEYIQDTNIHLQAISLMDQEDSCLWMLVFQGSNIYLDDINDQILQPISYAWDMDGFSQQFDFISIAHNRETEIDTVTIGITCYC